MFNWIAQAVQSVAKLFSPPAKQPAKPTPKPTPPKAPATPSYTDYYTKLAQTGTGAPYAVPKSTAPPRGQVDTRMFNLPKPGQKTYAQIQAEEAAQRQAIARAQAQAKLKADVEKRIKAQKEDADKLSKMSEFDRTKELAKREATKDSENSGKSKGFLDTITGGFTAETRARQYAQQKQAELQKDIKKYEDSLRSFTKQKAEVEQKLKMLANTAKTQQEYDAEVQKATKWLEKEVKVLNNSAATIQGRSEGYGDFSNKELSSGIAKVGKWLDPKNNPVTGVMGKVFQYTLGEGDANIPSLISAPSRAVNWIGNTTGMNKQVNKFDGSKEVASQDWAKAWQQTQRQRNFNIGNTSNTWDTEKVKESDYQDALKLYKQKAKPTGDQAWFKGKLPTKDQWLKEEQYAFQDGVRIKSGSTREDVYYKGAGLQSKKDFADLSSNTLEFLADPLFLAGGASKLARGSSWVAKGAKGITAVKDSVKATPWVQKAMDSKVGQGIQWLGKEKVTAKEDFAQKADAYLKMTTENQAKYLPKVADLQKKIRGNQIDYKVFDDLGKLTDEEAAILQRMTGLNTFAMRDNAKFLLSKEGAIKKKQLLDLHKRSQANASLMKKTDAVTSNRFDGKYYSQGWNQMPTDKAKYNFRAFRKNSHIQNAEQLKASQVERYFQSAVDDVGGAGEKLRKETTRAQSEVKKLLAEYSEASKKGRPEMEKAYRKISSKGTKFQKALGIPINVWKTSVLALRPAWYVNNKVYNISAGLNSAGLRYIPESLGMLKKGALTSARKENPEVISKIGKYLDNGSPLWKPASALEDADRLAAYKALIKNGTSPEEALKRVDKYFFKYTTKNWERPLKTAMPFWAWTKGTAGASVRMPLDRPLSAKLINANNDNNEKELNKLPEDMRKYYEGRQFFGNDKDGNSQWANTPFNPFTPKNFSNVSANPFISALAEISTQKDYYGNPLDEKSIMQNFLNKFPQVPLAKQVYDTWKANGGDFKQTIKYFSEISKSDGYAMTKERQGYDKSKTNYSEKLDPSNKLGENFLAYLGVPRGSSFDQKKYDKEKALTDLNAEFFKHDWDKEYPDYSEKVKAQEALAKSKGFDLEKDLYKGFWTKNDSELTKELKVKKDEARKYLNEFWTEYHNLPQDGNRNIWVKNKMKDIVDSKVILGNPFIADGLPDWFGPESRQKAVTKEFWNKYWGSSKDQQRKLLADNPQYNKYGSGGTSQKSIDYKKAKASGDWSEYTKKYGFKSQKQADYNKAKTSGDWSSYLKSYGTKKDSESAKFWAKYFASSNKDRKQLLADNPKYNKHANDAPKTQEEWDVIMDKVKLDRKTRALGNADFAAFFALRKGQALKDQDWAKRMSDRSSFTLKYKR